MKNSDTTLIFVTHSLSTAMDFCSRGIVLEKGVKIFEGDIEKAIEFYDSRL
jgi:teichoic acid transport system ATP-binding protein